MAAQADNQRPIVIKRVKKVAGGHHGGAWKVAYADFVTAMMAFFMLLWLVANPDKERLKQLAQYFSPVSQETAGASGAKVGEEAGMGHSSRATADRQSTQGKPASEAAASAASRGGTAAIPDASQRVIAAELRVALEASADASNTQVEPSRDGLRITLMDNDRQSMFRAGTAELNPFARALLGQVAAKLSKSGSSLAIEGHTDASGGQTDSNWRLSGERALAARGALIAAGVPADRFAEVVAMAATRPVYPDQPSRPENRRITIVLKAEASALPSDSSFKF